MDQITISIPTAPVPEYAERQRWLHYEDTAPDTTPILRVEVYDAKDGYGIVGEDMIPGRSVTIRADQDYQARLTYLGEGESEYPIFVYAHPENRGQTRLAWLLPDDREASGDLRPGRTSDLRVTWGTGRWIIEGKPHD